MVVFDTEVLLIFYLGEEGAEVVEELLKKVQNREIKGYINVINLTEFYYILYRRNPAIAEEKVRNLKAYGLEVVYVSDDRVWREAGKIKAVHGTPSQMRLL